MSKNSRTLTVKQLARVEGEGSLYLKTKNGVAEEVQLRIFESPRFFESFLQGRHFSEAPDLTSRICGICPVAYQIGAARAMENAMGVQVDGALRDLRRLIYCGEWIESHVLHMFLLHAPDFLGYEDSIRMAADHGDLVRMGLRMKKTGNKIMRALAGREIHPVNIKTGGFWSLPAEDVFQDLADDLKIGLDNAYQTLEFTTTLEYPDFERDYNFVSLQDKNQYPIDRGDLNIHGSLIPIEEYENYLFEKQVQHSTALHTIDKNGAGVCMGPLARYTLNFEKLDSEIQTAALKSGLSNRCYNPFRSIQVRAVETIYAFKEALRIAESWKTPQNKEIELIPKIGVGVGATEAPRGVCYHRYNLKEDGLIQEAKIVSPTAVNQGSMEEDIRQLIPIISKLSKDKFSWKCEQAIRNWDPCISCSTHFLKIKREEL